MTAALNSIKNFIFQPSEADGLSVAAKGVCVTTVGVGTYAVFELAKATAIAAAKSGISCLGRSPTSSYFAPIAQLNSLILKSLGQAHADCAPNLQALLVLGVASVAAGVVTYKAAKTWPNPTISLSFGKVPHPPTGAPSRK